MSDSLSPEERFRRAQELLMQRGDMQGLQALFMARQQEIVQQRGALMQAVQQQLGQVGMPSLPQQPSTVVAPLPRALPVPAQVQQGPRPAAQAAQGAQEQHIVDDDHAEEEEEEGVTYSHYRSSIRDQYPTLPEHPDPLVETTSLASVSLPRPTFEHSLGNIVDAGLLSDAQMEVIIYASQKFHGPRLADGKRAGFFLGDGAGVGKGRTIAALIKQHWAEGGRHVLWVSVSNDLRRDAERDLADIDCSDIEVHPQGSGNVPFGRLEYKGVLFVTYSLLVQGLKRVIEDEEDGNDTPTGSAAGNAKKKRKPRGKDVLEEGIEVPANSRLQQIINWLKNCPKGSFMVFDESHKAKNLLPDSRNQPSQTARAMVELQRRLPDAKVLYSSATGASEPRNLAYMTRLANGFKNTQEMINLLRDAKLGALEVAAMSLKSTGSYLARTLSYSGAEFGIVRAEIDPVFSIMYERSTYFWTLLLRIQEPLNMKATNRAQFWASHQRFYRSMLMAAKVRACARLAKQAVQEGMAAVIGLQSTGEAGTQAKKNQGDDLLDLISAPQMTLELYIKNNFPLCADEIADATLDGLEFQVFQAVQQWKHMLPASQCVGVNSTSVNDDASSLAGEGIDITAASQLSPQDLERMRIQLQETLEREEQSRQDVRAIQAAAQRNVQRARLVASQAACEGDVRELTAKLEELQQQLGGPITDLPELTDAQVTELAGGSGSGHQQQQQQGGQKKVWKVELMDSDSDSDEDGGEAEKRPKGVPLPKSMPAAAVPTGPATIPGPSVVGSDGARAEDSNPNVSLPSSATPAANANANAQADDDGVVDLTLDSDEEDQDQDQRNAQVNGTSSAAAGTTQVKAEPTTAAAAPPSPTGLLRMQYAATLKRLDTVKKRLSSIEIDLQALEREEEAAASAPGGSGGARGPPTKNRRSQAGKQRVKAEMAFIDDPNVRNMTMAAVPMAGHRQAVINASSALDSIPDEFPERETTAEQDFDATMGGNDYSNPAGGSNIVDEIRPQLQRIRKWLLMVVRAMELPANPLDDLIQLLGGSHKVAEMTGRKSFIGLDDDGNAAFMQRKVDGGGPQKDINLKEKEAFMSGRKLFAIISDAASTGISLQADRRVANQRRRCHFTLELPWSADKAIQQFGRSHRANQVSAPLYRIIVTPCGGEYRFASAAAKRLASLGALLRGDRNAVGAGAELKEFDVDNAAGSAAVTRVLTDILQDTKPLAGVTPPELPSHLQLPELVGASNAGAQGYYEDETVPPFYHYMLGKLLSVGLVEIEFNERLRLPRRTIDVSRFLNRLLGLPIQDQDLLFKYFTDTMDATITSLKSSGAWDDSMVSMRPGACRIINKRVIHTDPDSGGCVHHVELSHDAGLSWEEALAFKRDVVAKLQELHPGRPTESGFYVDSEEGAAINGVRRKAILLGTEILQTQQLLNTIMRIQRPYSTKCKNMSTVILNNGRYRRVSDEEAEALWKLWYAHSEHSCSHGSLCYARRRGEQCKEGKRHSEVHLLCGAVLPVWSRLDSLHSASSYARRRRVVKKDGSEGYRIIPLRVIKCLTSDQEAVVGVEAMCREQVEFFIEHGLIQKPRSPGENGGDGMVVPGGKKVKHFR